MHHDLMVHTNVHRAFPVQTREVQELQRQAQDVETHIRELKKTASKYQQQGAAIRRSVTSEQAAVDALSMRRTDLLSTAAMEQVCLQAKPSQHNVVCRQLAAFQLTSMLFVWLCRHLLAVANRRSGYNWEALSVAVKMRTVSAC